jgi:hypothetical protein
VYAFGVVLFETLTGRLPLEPVGAGQEAAAGLLRHMTDGRPPAAHPGIPRRLGALIGACLDLAPERRPTIARVRAELERYLARHRRRVRRALLAAAGAVAVAGAWLTAPGPRPPGTGAGALVGAPTPPIGDRHFVAGVEYLRDGYVSAAMREFDESNRTRPDGQNLAYLAYCQALAGQDAAAAGMYRQAIRDHNFAPAWVHNNLARSLLQAASGAAGLREAEAEAGAALALSPGLRPARLNRACARLQLALSRPKAVAPDPELVADVADAMREPPHTADLYSTAAALVVTFGGGRDECHARAVGYLEGAVYLGRPPGALAADPVLRRLAGRPDFQHLLTRPPGAPVVKPLNPYLVPPPLDSTE